MMWDTDKWAVAGIIAWFVGWLGLAIAFVVGWIKNIITIFDMEIAGITGELIIRIIGIFIMPIGAIFGYF